MSETREVELAYPYTDKAGKEHKPDAKVNLPVGEANELLHFGRARVPESKASKAAESRKEK